MRACCLVRDQPHYRADAVRSGLKALGYSLTTDYHGAADVVVMWNRYGWRDSIAKETEARGGKVIVMENGYLGNDFAGDKWYAASISQHNGAGDWNDFGGHRWDALGIKLKPPVERDGEVIVLPQRGIGPPGVAMPAKWLERTTAALRKSGVKFRIRPHPGKAARHKDLTEDLSSASYVITWGSGAALKALAAGIPVKYEFDKWIGATAATHLSHGLGVKPVINAEKRLNMFRRLAWAMWTVDEIKSGFAFDTLLAGM